MSIIFNSKNWVKEYVKKCQPYGWAKPGNEKRQPYLGPCWKITLHWWTLKIETVYLLEQELEFSKSLSSPIICPDDIDDSSCLAKHCSVLKISLLWHPYSFLRMIGKDSAKLTLIQKEFFMSFLNCKTYHLLTSTMARSVCPSLFFSCNILWVTCL